MICDHDEGFCYEDTNPDEYGKSVYTAPHWMWMYSFENPKKRRKPSAAGQAPKWFPHTPNPRAESIQYTPIHDSTAIKAEREDEIISCLEHRTSIYESCYEDQVVSLFCNHCKVTFKAKPTYRRRFNHTLVNHACAGRKRKQYVLGVKRRKCVHHCSSVKGCIFRVDAKSS